MELKLTVPVRWLRDLRLSPQELRLLLILQVQCLDMINQYTARTDLMDWTGLNHAALGKALASLRDRGVIAWAQGRAGQPNLYGVRPEAEWKLGPMPVGQGERRQQQQAAGRARRLKRDHDASVAASQREARELFPPADPDDD